jgi:20S proteasome alpha/beta subunit
MRINNATSYTGMAESGFYPDCRALLNYAQDEATKYLKEFRSVIPVRKLANTVSTSGFWL